MVVRWLLLLVVVVVHSRHHAAQLPSRPSFLPTSTVNQQFLQTRISPSLYRKFGPAQIQPRHEDEDVNLLEGTSFRSNLVDIPRGGGTGSRRRSADDIALNVDNDDSSDDGFIIHQVKDMIRSILKSTKDIPILQQTLSTFIHLIESIVGTRLMPSATIKKRDGKKKKKKNKNEAIPSETVKKVATNVKSTKQNIESTTTAAKPKTKRKTKSVVSTATKLQIKKDLKATNPNYRIQQELKSFLLDPPQYLSVKTGKNIRIWIVTIQGIGIYSGETFQLRIQFPPQYPTVPPSVYFLPPNIPTHEHVYTNGDICLSLLGKDWRPTMTAQSIAHSILSILTSATSKSLPMDNARHATNQPGLYQENWVYHDDNC